VLEAAHRRPSARTARDGRLVARSRPALGDRRAAGRGAAPPTRRRAPRRRRRPARRRPGPARDHGWTAAWFATPKV